MEKKLLKEIRNVELCIELKRTKSDIFQRRETNYQDTIAIKNLQTKKLNYTLISKTVYWILFIRRVIRNKINSQSEKENLVWNSFRCANLHRFYSLSHSANRSLIV